MDTFLRDIKFGVKLLLKDRGFTATAILTLGVCIGANTAIFTIVNSVLLKPLPVPESDRILLMANQYPNAGVGHSNNSGVPDYYDRLRDVNAFEEQAMFVSVGQTIEINGTPQRIRGMSATPSLFRLLKVSTAIGRSFNEDEGEVGNSQKIILSYGLWQELFGGDRNLAGKEVRLSGRPYGVVGVMPPDFLFVQPETRFWIPLAFNPQQRSDDNRHSNNWFNVGRLKPGSTITQAQSQVDALNTANLDRFPQYKQLLINAGFHTTVEPLQEMLVRDIRGTLYLLWAGAVFVLLIGAVNIANLVLARSNLRAKELVTRMALGAARIRVTRQLITESVILTMAGGASGLLLGSTILYALRSIGLSELPRASEIHMDVRVIIFTIAMSIVLGIVLGLVPVAQLLKSNLNNVLREEGRSGTSGRAARLVRRSLVVAQVAFAFVLLVGAGLLLASFRVLLGVDPGFQTNAVITAATNVPATRYAGEPEIRTFMTRTLDALRSVPGIVSAGATSTVPFGGDYSDSVIVAEGHQMQPGESLISPRQITVTPGYFESMSIQLVRGRYFGEHDVVSSQPVVIVDETLARKFWPNQDPIGRRMFRPENPNDLLKTDEHTRWWYVVGVVRDVRLEDLSGSSNKAGTYYFVWDQNPLRGANLIIKTSGDPANVMKQVRGAMAGIDSELPLYDIRTMDERMALSLLSRRASMLLASSFGLVALFLSAIGIYGVLAYLVTQRTREIGIRIALGSSAPEVFRLVLREGMVLVIAGFIIGFAGTAGLRHAMENQIYGVSPMDPAVLGAVFGVLGIVGLVACTLPARRATRVDPVSILN